MTADFLEDFLRASPELQDRLIAQQREIDTKKESIEGLEQKRLANLEELWLLVPRWRRAIILAAQWIQFKFTPKYF